MASSERQENNIANPWWGEHVHRYHEALKYITMNSAVMDIACGTGFGSLLVAERAGKVTGCDISNEAIEYCKRNFNRPNLEFRVEDGTQLTFDSGSFDVVISFETIEHTTAYSTMLNEFKRVLKKDGVAIISTPNFPVNSPSGKVTNPYHTQEFTYHELAQILNDCFNHVIIYGQKYVRYDKLTGWRKYAGKFVEHFFYLRGIRKLPVSFQDFFMNILVGKPIYPQPNDYEMTNNNNEIVTCKTFYAICKN